MTGCVARIMSNCKEDYRPAALGLAGFGLRADLVLEGIVIVASAFAVAVPHKPLAASGQLQS